MRPLDPKGPPPPGTRCHSMVSGARKRFLQITELGLWSNALRSRPPQYAGLEVWLSSQTGLVVRGSDGLLGRYLAFESLFDTDGYLSYGRNRMHSKYAHSLQCLAMQLANNSHSQRARRVPLAITKERGLTSYVSDLHGCSSSVQRSGHPLSKGQGSSPSLGLSLLPGSARLHTPDLPHVVILIARRVAGSPHPDIPDGDRRTLLLARRHMVDEVGLRADL